MSISGKKLSCSINGVIVAGNYGWSAEEGGNVLDRTTAEDEGFEREDMGVQNCHITIKGYMDIVTGAYTAVRRGNVITSLQLFRNIDDATPAFSVPEALVVRSKQGGDIGGKVEWDCEVHTQGHYDYNDPA